MFIFYGVVPALIIFLWYNAIQSWQRLGITSIADIIYLLFIFIVAPIGYGYFLWRRAQPELERQRNNESLMNDLYNFAMSDDYIWVGLQFDRINSLYNGLWFKSASREPCDCFNFMNNGYERVNERKMLEILQNLEKLTGGYLKVYKKGIGGYDPSITITHGTMPGGGDGYYVSTGGYDTSIINESAYVILGNEAERWRQADRDRAKAKSKLRKL